MTDVKIEDGIPMPTQRRRGRQPKWPFAEMTKAGQSFPMEGVTLGSARSQCTAAKARGLGDFYAAEVDGKIRVWRK
jgi:hypothetical protein